MKSNPMIQIAVRAYTEQETKAQRIELLRMSLEQAQFQLEQLGKPNDALIVKSVRLNNCGPDPKL